MISTQGRTVTLTKGQTAALRSNAKGRRNDKNAINLKLSQLIWTTLYGIIAGQAVWQHWGFDDWVDYLHKELQISLKQGKKHLQVWECFGIRLKGKWSIKLLLPFEKMVLISILADAGSVNTLLQQAAGKTVEDLYAEIHALSPGSFRPKVYRTHLNYDNEEYEDYKYVIRCLKTLMGEQNTSKAVLRALNEHLFCLQHSSPVAVKTVKKVSPKKKKAARKGAKK